MGKWENGGSGNVGRVRAGSVQWSLRSGEERMPCYESAIQRGWPIFDRYRGKTVNRSKTY